MDADALVLDLSDMHGAKKVEIMNSKGQQVFSLGREHTGGNELVIHTGGWEAGIYFINVTAGRRRVVEKIVVH